MSNLMIMSGTQRLIQVGTCLTTRTSLSRSVALLRNDVKRYHHSLYSKILHKHVCVSDLSLSLSGSDVRVDFKRHFETRTALVPRRSNEKDDADWEYRKMLEEAAGVEDAVKAVGQDSVITIPVHLVQRLERKKERDNTKRAIRERIVDASREGNKASVIIHCKHKGLNHYRNQTYDRTKEVPLASRAWANRKSSGDFFTIFPGFKRENPFHMKDTKEMTFEDLGVNEGICQNLKQMGIGTPTHIQVFGIPELLKGGHSIVAAETGCGKTLAYLVPIVQQIIQNRRYRVRQRPGHPSVIILTPSRELADQIYNVALQLTAYLDIRVKVLQGGNLGNKLQNPPSTQFVDILVTTTNAIKVLSSAGAYGLSKVMNVILDEADTLLDDSFFPELVGPFLNKFPWKDMQRDLQLILVGATLPTDLESSLGQLMNIDDFATVSTPGLHSVLPHVPQAFLRVKKSEKADKILQLVEKDMEDNIPVIIFCNRSKTCDWLSTHLNNHGIVCASVHGRMPLKYRRGRIDYYKRGDINVIVCTDLASRGIDAVRTQHVINYEFPLYLADYIHRCGRTGRVGSAKKCRVTNFISRPGEVKAVHDIERSVRKERSLPDVNANIKRLYAKHYGEFVEIKPIHEDEDASDQADSNNNDEQDDDASESGPDFQESKQA